MRCLTFLIPTTACAVASNTCPVGTTPSASREPRAEWCAATDRASASLPTRGRTYDTKLGTVIKPGGMPGGIEGPYSSWHPNGALASRGSYLNLGARSVPHGAWSFWYPDGKPRLAGHYRRGEPQGCFATWTEQGERRTGKLDGDELRVEPCMPPDDESVMPPGKTRADILLQGMVGPNEIGAANPVQVAPDPSMTIATSAGVRAHLGRLRIGGVAGLRIANETNYRALSIGATAAWQLPGFHSRIDHELSAEISIQRISAGDVQRSMVQGTASATFWTPLPALQWGMAIALSPTIEALVGVRVDGVPARDVDRTMRYCGGFTCTETQETWTIGRMAYGAVAGLRFSIR